VTYLGRVRPGGPPETRDLPDLSITKLSVGPLDNNAYLVTCKTTGERLLVDAANELARLLDLLDGGRLATVVTTHRHRDHWMALGDLVNATGANSVAHPADAAALPIVHQTVHNGDRVRVGESNLEVIHLVGHTPGSIALLYRDPSGFPHLFTGDSLFPGGPGKTTNPTDFTSLMDDLEAKVFGVLPDETWFYPGHGDDSTLGAERPSIPDWRARGW
jgi:glyoxylase-like metal-dependent hydrolase (beta-lactamase superfamily II)